MTFKQYFKTSDHSHPQVHVELSFETHIQEMKHYSAAIALGDIARVDAILPQFEPRPERHVGKEVAPQDGEINTLGRSIIGSGKAVVYLFESERDRDAFCDATAAIVATVYMQTPA